MNVNDNFENKDLPVESNDLNSSNVKPPLDSDTDENQNKEIEETVKESEVEHDSTVKEEDIQNDDVAEEEVATESSESTEPIETLPEDSNELSPSSETDKETKPTESVAEEATTEKSVVEEPAVEEAVAEESAVENPTAEKPVAEDIETEKLEAEVEETKAEDASTDATKEDVQDKPKDESKAKKVVKASEVVPLTFEEIVNNLRNLSKKEKFTRKELDKAQFLFLNECRKEIDAQKAAFIKEGGKEEDFAGKESELHTEGKNLLQTLAEKRKKIAADEEVLKEKNLERKLAIIERVKELTESQDDFNKIYQEFKSLQYEWNNIRLVPHGKEHELWKQFQLQVEKFYDIVRLHNEFRDYDFKKNLETKTGLCESAEKLLKEEDTVSAFHQLQKLHQDWRDIGPVARKDREPIWQRFKEVSAEINKKYQIHIESLKEKESENYELKVAICEELEAIDYSALKNTRDWDSKMREVLNLQAKWREIGYAPRRVNAKIFKRYRAACDLFFKNKNAYYQTIRGELDENLVKKTELCERAEALKDSTDWRKTTPEMIALQRDWKEIGMVPRRNSSAIWKRFISACDYFFEQKKKHSDSLHEVEVANLNLKKEINEKIKNIDTGLSSDEALNVLKDLMAEWQAVGYVPFKEKNNAYKDFTEATDSQFSRLNINKSERKLETFKSNIGEMTKSDNSRGQVFHERDKLMRQFERMKAELQTYENNIGFLTSSSKKGNVLVDDMNNKIDKIKAELELIVKKIDAIDEKI